MNKDNNNKQKENLLSKFSLKDEDGNERIYSFYRKAGAHYDLRCFDRKWKGTAKFILRTNKVVINKNCRITEFNEHKYIKKKIILEK